MASSLSEEDFSCPVCFDVFKNPVMLTCSHSFCEACVSRCWEASGSRDCPACRTPSHDPPRPNLVLKNICETFLQQRKALAETCQLHDKKLEFFCWDDEQPICVVCRDSETHSNHRICPIETLSCKRKSTLEAKLQPLRKQLKAFQEAKLIYEQTAKHIESQAEDVEEGIEGVLNDFLGFLKHTKMDKMHALKMEKRLKIQMVKEKKEKADREISSLTSTIESTEEAMGADVTTFLRDYEETEGRIQCTLQVPECVSGALIDVPKHLGNLRFSVWEEMDSLVFYFPIVLNPNTASKPAIVCPDLIQLGAPDPITAAAADGNDPASFPDHPGRFDFRHSVLGSEGFDSGTHCWEVEVGDSTEWCVGVMAESAQRKGDFTSRSGVWYLACRGEERYEACCPPDRPVALAVERLRRVRVQLDWERGELLFSNPCDPDTHLHTFTHTFTERVFPVCSADKSLSIMPGDVSVKRHAIMSR
ncbi:E3 ubiquitin-protein ligase TRIM35-like [Sardina pilchardus]|uniref:E3 ubiquitin-protein ligase TRIM35-like n=1 Tax=Sardina pilchardus TaxID=27697 RepID=UPI002E132364